MDSDNFSSISSRYSGFHILKFNNGGIIVFDPTIQPTNSPFVYLFGVQSRRMIMYRKTDARTDLVRIDDKRENIQALALYTEWKALNGYQIKALVEVDKSGGYRMNQTERRITYCYNCKRELDSKEDRICAKCGWIRCRCGACGCQF